MQELSEAFLRFFSKRQDASTFYENVNPQGKRGEGCVDRTAIVGGRSETRTTHYEGRHELFEKRNVATGRMNQTSLRGLQSACANRNSAAKIASLAVRGESVANTR